MTLLVGFVVIELVGVDGSRVFNSLPKISGTVEENFHWIGRSF
jgi:hypothetical protein